MAFPIPAHLPRKKDLDVSTTVLSKMSETSLKALNHELASTWVSELDLAIRQTKDRIHERLQADLPAFEQQLASSKSVQERLYTLSSNVDQLQDKLSHPETGLVPTLIATLTRHASLAQESADADAMDTALTYLARCKREMQELVGLVQGGKLPEAVERYRDVEVLLAEQQPSLQGTEVYVDLQRRFRAMKDKTDEQLNEAYSRSIIVTAAEIIIRPSVQVRDSDNVLSLPPVLSSISPTNLSTLMATLRRDLTSHYIDFLLGQAATLELSTIPSIAGAMEYKLTVFHAPQTQTALQARIDNVATVLSFLNEHLFPHLPSGTSFPITLSRPLTNALLNKLLVPSLPSSTQELPAFLQLVEHAVQFEGDYIRDVLQDTSAQDVQSWASSVDSHYEKKRRVQILERARAIIIRAEDDSSSFQAEFSAAQDLAVPEDKLPPATENSNKADSPEEAAWGFEDEANGDVPAVDEDGWGFDDDIEPEPAQEPDVATAAPPASTSDTKEDDPADAWGWNDDDDDVPAADDGDASTDSSAWDDPWGDNPEPAAPPPSKVPKAATKLEKLSNKGKTSSAAQSPVVATPPPPKPSSTSAPPQPKPTLAPKQQTETYLVSGRVLELFWLVEDVLREAAELAASNILQPQATSSTSQIGSVISQTAALVLDLYRGLYPVAAASPLASPKRGMGFSNDCLWLSAELNKVLSQPALSATTKTKLSEARERLKTLGKCWYDETIGRMIEQLDDVLDRAQGFVGTTEQDRFDECEEAVNEVLQDIRKFAQHVKPVLAKSKYYEALGVIVNAALGRVLQDVLALPDITEVESHKLNDLCRILNALEGLFVEDPSQPSFVVSYVPLWLKFSYLSELLEASIADISYLFEEGALVDFEIDELVNLVRALFADTPLRANTINKLLQGHPVRS